MRVAIIHYHLKRGGVTRVVDSTLRGFESLEPHPKCVVLAGEVPPGFRYQNHARGVEGLHYSNAQSTTPDSRVLLENMRLAGKDALGGDPDLWHIHNHSLGKNNAMPGVVALLAESGEPILLHMHDFAEDGRPDNYQLNLERPEYARHLYPDAPNVHYGVLNGRDYAIFEQAGIQPERLHLLPNPVDAEITQHPDGNQRICETLGADRLVLYPVRAVRRKNFGEMLLWAALAAPGDAFATTLGPTNQNYHAAYQRWQAFAGKHKLPVHFGIGETHDWPFEAIMQSAHAILTTSMAEGFGLAFLEPWLFGKSIVGRDLPLITADFKNQGIQMEGLYESLPIPCDWIDMERLKTEITLGLTKAYAAYGRPLPDDAVERALQAISPATGKVDFGGLDEALQETVIAHILAEPSAASELPRLEHSLQANRIQENAAHITQTYNPAQYADGLSKIYTEIHSSDNAAATQYLNPSKVLDGFLQPEAFRLLRT